MIIIQTINYKTLNECFIIENSNKILFIYLEQNEHKINIKSINKFYIGKEQLILFDEIDSFIENI